MTYSMTDTTLTDTGWTTELSCSSPPEEDWLVELEDRIGFLEQGLRECKLGIICHWKEGCLPETADCFERLLGYIHFTLGRPIPDQWLSARVAEMVENAPVLKRKLLLQKTEQVLVGALSFVREYTFGCAAQLEATERELRKFRKEVKKTVEFLVGHEYMDDGYLFGESYDALDALYELTAELHREIAAYDELQAVRVEERE